MGIGIVWSFLAIFPQILPKSLSNDANLQKIGFGNCEEAFLDITLDNQKLSPPLIEKIKKYNEAMKFASGGETTGTGATRKNPCYEYRGDSTTTCPKCSSSVTEDYENGYKIQIKYIEYKRRNEEVKVYDDNVCKSINFNGKIPACEYNMEQLCSYFEKNDETKKYTYTFNVKKEGSTETTKKTVELVQKYIILDGERFDLPHGLNLRGFFIMNDKKIFDRKFINPKTRVYEADQGHSVYFFHRDDPTKCHLGTPLGTHGYAWKNMVYIYKCNSCGLKYHILRISPLSLRDKSLDNKITKTNQGEGAA